MGQQTMNSKGLAVSSDYLQGELPGLCGRKPERFDNWRPVEKLTRKKSLSHGEVQRVAYPNLYVAIRPHKTTYSAT